MSNLISEAGTLASCAHAQTGSSKVFIKGKGVCRAGIDKVDTGLISDGVTDGASLKVFVESYKVALFGTKIVDHGISPHDKATTSVTQTKVYSG